MTLATILQGRVDAVFSVTPETLVREVVALLADHRIGAVPVSRTTR
jgi:CBS domain-containing protein